MIVLELEKCNDDALVNNHVVDRDESEAHLSHDIVLDEIKIYWVQVLIVIQPQCLVLLRCILSLFRV